MAGSAFALEAGLYCGAIDDQSCGFLRREGMVRVAARLILRTRIIVPMQPTVVAERATCNSHGPPNCVWCCAMVINSGSSRLNGSSNREGQAAQVEYDDAGPHEPDHHDES